MRRQAQNAGEPRKRGVVFYLELCTPCERAQHLQDNPQLHEQYKGIAREVHRPYDHQSITSPRKTHQVAGAYSCAIRSKIRYFSKSMKNSKVFSRENRYAEKKINRISKSACSPIFEFLALKEVR